MGSLCERFSLCVVFRFLRLWLCLAWLFSVGIHCLDCHLLCCLSLAFVVVIDWNLLFSLALRITLLYFKLYSHLLIINKEACLCFKKEKYDFLIMSPSFPGTIFAYGVTSSGKTHTMHVRCKICFPQHFLWSVFVHEQGRFI